MKPPSSVRGRHRSDRGSILRDVATTTRVFSYGTLRQDDVQTAVFGRSVPTVPDSLPGFRLEWITITDPEVIATSGTDQHPILRRGAAHEAIDGAYLELSDAELAEADDYEVDDYRRVEVTLASGASAWVYVASEELDVPQVEPGRRDVER